MIWILKLLSIDGLHPQPFLDSDMQSRFYDFGGDTIIRADQYVITAPNIHLWAGFNPILPDMSASHPIVHRKKVGSSPAYRSQPQTGRSVSPPFASHAVMRKWV